MTRSARRTPRPAVPRRQSDDARQAHGRIDRRESSPHALPGAARPFPTVRDHRIARFGGNRFGASSRQATGQARPADSPKVTSRRQPFRTRRSFPSKSVGLCSACELALLSSSRSRGRVRINRVNPIRVPSASRAMSGRVAVLPKSAARGPLPSMAGFVQRRTCWRRGGLAAKCGLCRLTGPPPAGSGHWDRSRSGMPIPSVDGSWSDRMPRTMGAALSRFQCARSVHSASRSPNTGRTGFREVAVADCSETNAPRLPLASPWTLGEVQVLAVTERPSEERPVAKRLILME